MSNKRFYATSQDAWRGMLRAIRRARHSVYLEMYIFEDTPDGFDFTAALCDRATAGMRVVVILDALGSHKLTPTIRAQLTDAGVELLVYDYWFHRTHRKMLVIDERIAFVGGVNIGARFAGWDDLVVRVRGRVVRSVLHSFARAYRVCGGTDKELLAQADKTVSRKTRVWFIEYGLAGKRYEMRQHYETAIDTAKHTVTIVSAYLLPARWLTAVVARAVKRGVIVEFIVPEWSDHAFLYPIHMHNARVLTNLGVRCLFGTRMNHAKAMLIDDRVAVVGSQNIDTLSFKRNAEAGIYFETRASVKELVGIIDVWRKDAVDFENLTIVTHWYDKISVLGLRLMSPIL